MSKKFVRICPKCKSTDVSRDLSIQSYARGSFFNQFKCNNCGYAEIFFPEMGKGEMKRYAKKRK